VKLTSLDGGCFAVTAVLVALFNWAWGGGHFLLAPPAIDCFPECGRRSCPGHAPAGGECSWCICKGPWPRCFHRRVALLFQTKQAWSGLPAFLISDFVVWPVFGPHPSRSSRSPLYVSKTATRISQLKISVVRMHVNTRGLARVFAERGMVAHICRPSTGRVISSRGNRLRPRPPPTDPERNPPWSPDSCIKSAKNRPARRERRGQDVPCPIIQKLSQGNMKSPKAQTDCPAIRGEFPRPQTLPARKWRAQR